MPKRQLVNYIKYQLCQSPSKKLAHLKISVWRDRGGTDRKKFTTEQIIFKLRGVEVLVGPGESIAMVCREVAVME